MKLGELVNLNGKVIKLDLRYDCSDGSVIYVAICKLCKEKFEVNNNFYIGQTVNSFMSRLKL